MTCKPPHFVLFSESRNDTPPSHAARRAGAGAADNGGWHFVLQTPDGATRLDVSDSEAGASVERLELLALVRGLEALDEPSRVTLVTSSGAIRRGLRFGLDSWRESQWQWERFGRMTPVKNADLWQRVDQALQFHDVDCRMIRFDPPADDLSRPVPQSLLAPNGHRPRPATLPPAARTVRRSQRGSRYFGVPSFWQAVARAGRRLFGWCGLCRMGPRLVIATR